MKMQLHVTGNGRPLVIVGGGLTGILSFVPHAERLASTRQLARAQPLAVQLGLDQAPLPDDYSIDMESRALEAAIDDLGWKQPIDLVGWSTGGVIALDFALDHPERVRSLVLIEPDAPWVLPDRGAADPDVQAAKERASRWARGVSEADLAAFLDEMLGPGQSARDNPRWDVWNQHRGALRAVAAIYKHRDDVARLGRFSRPVLLIKGEGTEQYNAIISDALSRALPTARVVELPGGHLAPVVAMDRFLGEMEAFQAAAEPNR
jgi:pimeloyl-ACP methyl ester carboxylesterase